jgi:PKD repeat protein
VITVTNPSTVLPLESVNVKATNSNYGSGSDIADKIQWNFGDPSGQYNTMNGFNAAHAYATAGTYTITLTITTPDGHVGVTTQTVTIAADNRPTVTIASGQALPTFQSNTRYLFQAGGTWNWSGKTLVDLSGLQHVFIGSYGSGAQPTFFYNGPQGTPDTITMSSSSTGIVVDGISFDSSYSNNSGNAALPTAASPNGNDIAFLNDTFGNLGDDLNLNASPNNVLIENCNSPGTNTLSGYFAWIQGSELVFVGNHVANSTGQADMRIGGPPATDVVIEDSTLAKTDLQGNGYKNCISVQDSQYVTIYGNDLTNGPVQLGPIGVGNTASQSTQDAVVDSNTFHNSQITISPQTLHSMVRNNVLFSDNSSAYSTTIYVNSTQGGGYNWQVNGVWILNNTADSTATDGTFLQIQNGESKNLVFDNNLWIDPNLEMGDNQSAFINDGNNDWSSFSQIKDNVFGTFKSENSWFQGGMFYDLASPGQFGGWENMASFESAAGASGDVYENVSLGATYSINTNGFTAGSSLALAA